MDQKPTVGRIVHFRLPATHPRAGDVRPAVIVIVNGDKNVNLHVFRDPANDHELREADACSAEYSEEPKPRTWCWPPRA